MSKDALVKVFGIEFFASDVEVVTAPTEDANPIKFVVSFWTNKSDPVSDVMGAMLKYDRSLASGHVFRFELYPQEIILDNAWFSGTQSEHGDRFLWGISGLPEEKEQPAPRERLSDPLTKSRITELEKKLERRNEQFINTVARLSMALCGRPI